jgi:sugar lactone lactonase YvrE
MKPIIPERLLLSLAVCCVAACHKSDSAPTPLTISTINPVHGPENSIVIITGTGFSTTLSNDHVFFNGKAAIVTAVSATQLTATVPQKAGTGNVSVTINGATQTGAVFTYDYSDAQVTTVAGSGANGRADGTGTAASFSGLSDITTDAAGNLYVTDGNYSNIRQITPAGVVTTFAGGQVGFQNGTGSNARFNTPQGVAIDASGNLYVCDAGNNVIRMISPAGAVTTLAGTGVAGHTDGSAASAQFNFPERIVIDAGGNLFVTDNDSYIRKITPDGTVSTLAGMNSEGYVDGPGISAQFSVPEGMLPDANGNLFVCDGANSLIRKITSANVVSTLAGSGAGFADGPPASAKFNFPIGIVHDSSGNMMITDENNNSIRMITPAGIVSTLAGSTTAGFADGNKATARFNAVCGIVVDKNGTIYVTDYLNHRIRKIVLE